jgi:hypothetical protein
LTLGGDGGRCLDVPSNLWSSCFVGVVLGTITGAKSAEAGLIPAPIIAFSPGEVLVGSIFPLMCICRWDQYIVSPRSMLQYSHLVALASLVWIRECCSRGTRAPASHSMKPSSCLQTVVKLWLAFRTSPQLDGHLNNTSSFLLIFFNIFFLCPRNM